MPGVNTPPDNTSARSATHVVLKMVVAAVFVMLFIYLLYPKLAEFFLRAQQGKTPAGQTQVEQGTFDPYAPILVVPNDYEEE